MRIGEFARRAGVSPSKIRFYEARKLLPQPGRSANGYRSYDAADLRVVSFIDSARSLGFSLADLERFMSRTPEERRTKAGVVEALQAKLVEVDTHLAQASLQRTRILGLLAELGADGGGGHDPA